MTLDVEHSFTHDRPNYWDKFPEHIDDIDDFNNCKTELLNYIIELYGNKKLPNGDIFNLEYKYIDSFGYNLCFNNIRLGSDSILQIYWYWSRPLLIKNLIDNDVKKYIAIHTGLSFYDFIKNYLKKAYTIGGHIIFPKERDRSMNINRGYSNKFIRDRFDLTLECIKRYYDNTEQSINDERYNPLGRVIYKNYEDFFKLFCNFKGFVDFFYLNPIVSEDYNSIKYFICNSNNNFLAEPLPRDYREWYELYENQISFLEKRNELIRIAYKQNKV